VDNLPQDGYFIIDQHALKDLSNLQTIIVALFGIVVKGLGSIDWDSWHNNMQPSSNPMQPFPATHLY
jgi:hypothetical protein